MAGTVSLHRHGNQSGGGWKGKSFRQVAVKDRKPVNHCGVGLFQPRRKC